MIAGRVKSRLSTITSALARGRTSAISAVRSAEAGGGTGCRQVDTDSNARTARDYGPAKPPVAG